MNGLEERVAKIEGTLSQMNERLNHFGNEIKDIRQEMKSNFRWLVGILLGVLIPMWVSIIGTIIALFFKVVK